MKTLGILQRRKGVHRTGTAQPSVRAALHDYSPQVRFDEFGSRIWNASHVWRPGEPQSMDIGLTSDQAMKIILEGKVATSEARSATETIRKSITSSARSCSGATRAQDTRLLPQTLNTGPPWDSSLGWKCFVSTKVIAGAALLLA